MPNLEFHYQIHQLAVFSTIIVHIKLTDQLLNIEAVKCEALGRRDAGATATPERKAKAILIRHNYTTKINNETQKTIIPVARPQF